MCKKEEVATPGTVCFSDRLFPIVSESALEDKTMANNLPFLEYLSDKALAVVVFLNYLLYSILFT